MAARSIASLSISFGLVSIPIKLYSATETAAAIQFKLLGSDGSRLRQQYVSDGPPAVSETPATSSSASPETTTSTDFRPQLVGKSTSPPEATAMPRPAHVAAKTSASASLVGAAPDSSEAAAERPRLVERSEMIKGYEFEKGKFVTFTPDELKALQEGARETIDIVSFIPERSVDPIYFEKAYYLAPDKRGGKPYSLLLEAMRTTGRVALAKWAFRAKEYVVQIRPTEGGLVLQQMLYAEEVRSISDLGIDLVVVGEQELKLAQLLIQQSSADGYEPGLFFDEERRRILAAVEGKIAGRQIVAHEHASQPSSGKVIDLMEALRASLAKPLAATPVALGTAPNDVKRKSVRRSGKAVDTDSKTRSRRTVA